MRRCLSYLGKRSLIAPDSDGSSSWQLADENSATPFSTTSASHAMSSVPLLLVSPSCGALKKPDSLLSLSFFIFPIRTPQWKYETHVSLAAKGTRENWI